MRSFLVFLPVVAIAIACSSGSGPSSGNGTPEGGTNGEGGSGDGASSCALASTVAAPSTPSFLTNYCCPDQAAVDACPQDVVPCTPTNRTRGTIGLGFGCNSITVNASGASMDELGDDCAPIAKYASAAAPKGTYCLSQISSGRTYCSHDCMTTADCADLYVMAYCPLSSGAPTGQCTLPGG